jgi:nucleotide-binding universal stress UspA family protein
MKKVLIAIDYNPSAQKVAETGYAFAKLMNAEISVIHAIADISHYTMEYMPIMGFKGCSSDSPFMNIDEQKQEAVNFLECVAKHLGDNNIKTCVLDGRTSETILEYAIRWKADLIVMGTQNHSGFEKLCPGNVTSLILKRSGIPVLVIPEEKAEMNLEKINQYSYLQV